MNKDKDLKSDRLKVLFTDVNRTGIHDELNIPSNNVNDLARDLHYANHMSELYKTNIVANRFNIITCENQTVGLMAVKYLAPYVMQKLDGNVDKKGTDSGNHGIYEICELAKIRYGS